MAPRSRVDREIFERLQAAEIVAARLRVIVRSLGPSFESVQFYMRIRVKTYESITRKLYSKRHENKKELYSIADLTDIVGFRIVTLYDDDIPTVLDHVLSMVRSNGRGLPQNDGRLDQPL